MKALLVGQVGGSRAVTLGACGLAISDGVHGVGQFLALGAAVVVVGGACEVVRIAVESAIWKIDDLQDSRQTAADCWAALGLEVPETAALSVAVPLLA